MNANPNAGHMNGNDGANVVNMMELHHQRAPQLPLPQQFYNPQMAISHAGHRASLEYHQQRRRSGDEDHVRPLLMRTPGHWGSSSTGRDKRDFEHSFCDCKNMDLCRCGEDFKGLEWIWDVRSKSSACDISGDGVEVVFHPRYSVGTAAVRGSVPMSEGHHFWEVKMLTSAFGTDILIGVGTEAKDLNSSEMTFCALIGRDSESWGMSYRGGLQHAGTWRPQNHSIAKFGHGSLIGCHLDMWHGTLTYYVNRKPLGVAFTGLRGKRLYPMISSTAAKSQFRLITAESFPHKLQYLCCETLRARLPPELNVLTSLQLPPGLRLFLENNLSWFLKGVDKPPQTVHMPSASTECKFETEQRRSQFFSTAPQPLSLTYSSSMDEETDGEDEGEIAVGNNGTGGGSDFDEIAAAGPSRPLHFGPTRNAV